MTDILTPNYRRRTKLLQPNYTRSRAVYRSPMNSEKMNLAAEQLRFDLTNLRVQTDKLKTLLNQQLDITNVERIFNVDRTTPSFVSFPGTTGNYLSSPDALELDITGGNDLTLIVRAALNDWSNGVEQYLVTKYDTGTANRSYSLSIGTTGIPTLRISPDGTTVATILSTAAVSTVAADGKWVWLAVTLDVDNGATQKQGRFWWSSNGITWTLLGTTPAPSAGIISLFSSTSPLNIGAHTNGTAGWSTGKISYVSVRSGMGVGGIVGGTEVFRFDADNNITNTGATTFTATTGQIITVNKGNAAAPTTTLVNNSYETLLEIPKIAAKVKSLRERVRRLEIVKGINS